MTLWPRVWDTQDVFRVTQFSDMHFCTEPEGEPRNTDDTWDAVFADAFESSRPIPELVVITGDIAHNGTEAEYEKVAEKLARLPVPAVVCPGNHDRQVPFDAILPRPGLSNGHTMRVGSWLFVFADSNADGRDQRPDGSLVDREDRTHKHGRFGDPEVVWVAETVNRSDAEHALGGPTIRRGHSAFSAAQTMMLNSLELSTWPLPSAGSELATPTPTPPLRPDSTGRRNTSMMEVWGRVDAGAAGGGPAVSGAGAVAGPADGGVA